MCPSLLSFSLCHAFSWTVLFIYVLFFLPGTDTLSCHLWVQCGYTVLILHQSCQIFKRVILGFSGTSNLININTVYKSVATTHWAQSQHQWCPSFDPFFSTVVITDRHISIFWSRLNLYLFLFPLFFFRINDQTSSKRWSVTPPTCCAFPAQHNELSMLISLYLTSTFQRAVGTFIDLWARTI